LPAAFELGAGGGATAFEDWFIAAAAAAAARTLFTLPRPPSDCWPIMNGRLPTCGNVLMKVFLNAWIRDSAVCGSKGSSAALVVRSWFIFRPLISRLSAKLSKKTKRL
jgi:hypothetical protein